MTTLTAFYDEMNGLEDKGRRVAAGYPASGEVLQAAFSAHPHRQDDGMSKWMVKWTETCQNCQTKLCLAA